MMPEKHFYTIGDVCQITGTKPHILRYWESKFKLLRPARRYSGHRKYTQAEIDIIHRIRYLVLDRKFTLAGAKREINRQFGGKMKPAETPGAHVVAAAVPLLRDIKKDIEECLEILTPRVEQQELVGLK